MARRHPQTGWLVQYDGQVPDLLAACVAGRVGHQNLPVLYTPQDDEVSAGGKVPLSHNSDHQLAAAQGVKDALGLRSGTAHHGQPPRLGRIGDQSVVGTAPAAPAAVLIRPLGHLHGINNIICQRGHHNGHGGGAVAIAADVVRTVGLVGPALVQLIEVNHLRGTVGETDTAQGGNRSTAILGVLEHPITQEQAEVLGVVHRQ